MSSCVGATGACSFNFDFIKPPASSSSNCSSTLNKSSSLSSLSISTKRARTPRKRPNQSYIEAATLLSTACPSVFSSKTLHKKHSSSVSSLSSSSSEILSQLPICSDSNFLIDVPSYESNPSYRFKFKPANSFGESCVVALREASPPKSPDYDVDSIFDDEGEEGIDGIMGKLTMNDCDSNSSSFNPFVGSVKNITKALRGARIGDLWSPKMMVQMNDIVSKSRNVLPLLKEKKKKSKKKKKVEKEATNEYEIMEASDGPSKLEGKIKSGLGLRLIHEEVIKAWGARGFPFSCARIQESSAEISSRLAEIDLSPDEETEAGVMRQESIHKYQEKRKTRQFAKKICYQVRKVNADCRPRIEGRFVKKTRKMEEIRQ